MTRTDSESGRSLLETLAVLVVMIILLLAGLIGYDWAVHYWKKVKTVEEISEVATLYGVRPIKCTPPVGKETCYVDVKDVVPSMQLAGAKAVVTTDGGKVQVLASVNSAVFLVEVSEVMEESCAEFLENGVYDAVVVDCHEYADVAPHKNPCKPEIRLAIGRNVLKNDPALKAKIVHEVCGDQGKTRSDADRVPMAVASRGSCGPDIISYYTGEGDCLVCPPPLQRDSYNQCCHISKILAHPCQVCDCPTGTVCDTGSKQCVECVNDSDCKNPNKPVCDTTQHKCVPCIPNTRGEGICHGTKWCHREGANYYCDDCLTDHTPAGNTPGECCYGEATCAAPTCDKSSGDTGWVCRGCSCGQSGETCACNGGHLNDSCATEGCGACAEGLTCTPSDDGACPTCQCASPIPSGLTPPASGRQKGDACYNPDCPCGRNRNGVQLTCNASNVCYCVDQGRACTKDEDCCSNNCEGGICGGSECPVTPYITEGGDCGGDLEKCCKDPLHCYKIGGSHRCCQGEGKQNDPCTSSACCGDSLSCQGTEGAKTCQPVCVTEACTLVPDDNCCADKHCIVRNGKGTCCTDKNNGNGSKDAKCANDNCCEAEFTCQGQEGDKTCQCKATEDARKTVGAACSEKCPCVGEELQCVEGKCQSICEATPEQRKEVGATCSEKCPCGDELECVDGTCQRPCSSLAEGTCSVNPNCPCQGEVACLDDNWIQLPNNSTAIGTCCVNSKEKGKTCSLDCPCAEETGFTCLVDAETPVSSTTPKGLCGTLCIHGTEEGDACTPDCLCGLLNGDSAQQLICLDADGKEITEDSQEGSQGICQLPQEECTNGTTEGAECWQDVEGLEDCPCGKDSFGRQLTCVMPESCPRQGDCQGQCKLCPEPSASHWLGDATNGLCCPEATLTEEGKFCTQDSCCESGHCARENPEDESGICCPSGRGLEDGHCACEVEDRSNPGASCDEMCPCAGEADSGEELVCQESGKCCPNTAKYWVDSIQSCCFSDHVIANGATCHEGDCCAEGGTCVTPDGKTQGVCCTDQSTPACCQGKLRQIYVKKVLHEVKEPRYQCRSGTTSRTETQNHCGQNVSVQVSYCKDKDIDENTLYYVTSKAWKIEGMAGDEFCCAGDGQLGSPCSEDCPCVGSVSKYFAMDAKTELAESAALGILIGNAVWSDSCRCVANSAPALYCNYTGIEGGKRVGTCQKSAGFSETGPQEANYQPYTVDCSYPHDMENADKCYKCPTNSNFRESSEYVGCCPFGVSDPYAAGGSEGARLCWYQRKGDWTSAHDQDEIPEGYYLSGGRSVICPKGNFCQKGKKQLCASGMYQDQEGAGACMRCPGGKYCPGEGTIEPKTCEPGHYCPPGSSAPKECPEGTYQDNGNSNFGYARGSSSCQYCVRGEWSEKGTVYQTCPPIRPNEPYKGSCCATCPAGYYCNGQGVKKICPTGHYCPKGSYEPTPCPVGQYQNQEGQSSCQGCPSDAMAVGHYCNDQGQKEICPAGYYCPQGTSKAIPCGSGYYQDEQGQGVCKSCPWGLSAERACYGDSKDHPCPVGHKCKNGVPEPCPAGEYQDQPGQSSCKTCGPGTVAKSTGATSCTPCGNDRYSQDGKTCTYCESPRKIFTKQVGDYSTGWSQSCCSVGTVYCGSNTNGTPWGCNRPTDCHKNKCPQGYHYEASKGCVQ